MTFMCDIPQGGTAQLMKTNVDDRLTARPLPCRSQPRRTWRSLHQTGAAGCHALVASS